MFRIVKFNCCGLDVHKTWIYACIGITDSQLCTEYYEARFSSFPKDLRRLAAWFQEYKYEEVCINYPFAICIKAFPVDLISPVEMLQTTNSICFLLV